MNIDIQSSIGSPDRIPPSGHWGAISEHILTTERLELWKPYARTMTDWMREYASQIGRSMPALWRYKNSGRYYSEKRQELAQQGTSLPPLENLPESVSAEIVELFEKVERVVPESVAQPLRLRALRGQVTKRELTKVWTTYRGILGGKTARGYGVERPRADPVQGLKVQCLLQLAKNIREILRRDDAGIRLLFADALDAPNFFSGIDVLGLEPTAGQIVTLHAFEICDFSAKPETGLFGARRATDRNVHYWWAVSPEVLSDSQLRYVAPGVGVIVATETHFSILREPKAHLRDYTDGELFLSKLLLHTMRTATDT